MLNVSFSDAGFRSAAASTGGLNQTARHTQVAEAGQ